MTYFELWFIIILLVFITIKGLWTKYSPHIECIENNKGILILLYYNSEIEEGYKRKSLKLFNFKK